MAAAQNAACAKGIFYFITDSIENAQKTYKSTTMPASTHVPACEVFDMEMFLNIEQKVR